MRIPWDTWEGIATIVIFNVDLCCQKFQVSIWKDLLDIIINH